MGPEPSTPPGIAQPTLTNVPKSSLSTGFAAGRQPQVLYITGFAVVERAHMRLNMCPTKIRRKNRIFAETLRLFNSATGSTYMLNKLSPSVHVYAQG